jgi:hypothetical protein
MIADRALISYALAAILSKRLVRSLPRRVKSQALIIRRNALREVQRPIGVAALHPTHRSVPSALAIP